VLAAASADAYDPLTVCIDMNPYVQIQRCYLKCAFFSIPVATGGRMSVPSPLLLLALLLLLSIRSLSSNS
jgi:hypothetical protein